MKRKLVILGAALILLAQSAFVLSLATYQVSWTNLLSGSGGHTGSGAHQVDFTVGQTAAGTSAGNQYQAQLGYWALPPGEVPPVSYDIYLPVIQR